MTSTATPADLDRACSSSRFLTRAHSRDAQLCAPERVVARAPGEIARVVADSCAASADESALMQTLRALREREMARIALRDLTGLAALDETLRDLSALADAACAAAVDFSWRKLSARYGKPCDEQGSESRPMILGMGKLGGRELNFSSDIDLIFCFTLNGETDGERGLSNEEFFARMVQDVTKILSARTADGFVFRVDWMLRPFGSAGPAAISFAAAESYYQNHGREWERYAMIKARPVAGDLAAGEDLLKTLRPFVYRRYLDYNAFGALRELKRMIEDEVRRKDLHDNIKLGAGGIREVEFIVQALQLVRGGPDPRLRGTQLRPLLKTLGALNLLPREATDALDAAYVFLRRAENAIQMYDDEQTHELPENPEARALLCSAMGGADWPDFVTRLVEVRERVGLEFDRVFAAPADEEAVTPTRATLASFWQGTLDAAATIQALPQFGADAGEIVGALGTLKSSRLVRAMNETATARLLDLLALLLEEISTAVIPAKAGIQSSTMDSRGEPGLDTRFRGYDVSTSVILKRVLQIVEAVSGRSTYLTLLRESAVVRGQLVRLCAASPWLTDFLTKSPAMLDALLAPDALARPPNRDEMALDLAARCVHVGPQDTEQGMDVLRRFQKETTLRIAAADLLHGLPLVKVSDHLTWLAEVIMAQTLELAWAEMRAQYGEPRRVDGGKVGFAVIAYGKFGGIEMSYGSDLDVVFLHDADAPLQETVGGPRALPAQQYLSRLGQRLVSWLSTYTPAGRAYEVDLELRPDGRRGMGVSSLAGFAEYQRTHAWTWEHQALTRARHVAGDAGVGDAFTQLRAEVLMRERDAAKLREDIVHMRERMRASLDKSTGDLWDAKQGAGGMIDIEFITQFLVLRDAHKSAAVVEYSDNWRQLDALEAAATVTAEHKAQLIEVYRVYRAWVHQRGLQNENALAPQSQFGRERDTIRALWKEIMG